MSEVMTAALAIAQGRQNEDSEQQNEVRENIKWEPPVELYEYALPKFPVRLLSHGIRQWVEGVALETQTPPDMAALSALSVLATACQRKMVVSPKDGYVEQLSVWTLVVMHSGNRKSAVHRAAIQPIIEHEKQREIELQEEISKSQARYDALLAEYESVKKKDDKKITRDDKINKLAELKMELAKNKPIRAPRYIVDDVTQERLVVLLNQHGESLGVFSAEADAFALMAGRYSKDVNIELFLKSYTGDRVTVDRINKKPTKLESPALSMALTCQPSLLVDIGSVSQFKGRGLLARFWYTIPRSFVGHRDPNPPSMSVETRQTYHTIISNLLRIEATDRPYILTLDEDAFDAWQAYLQLIEPQLSPYAELSRIDHWAEKLVGSAVRIACLLHLADNHDHQRPWEQPITGDTFHRATDIAEYLKEHALAAFTEMRANPEVENARLLLQRIKDIGKPSMTVRDLHQAARGRGVFQVMAGMEPALKLLIENGYIYEGKTERHTRSGRNPSQKLHFNPYVFATRNPQNELSGDFESKSEYSEGHYPGSRKTNAVASA